MQQIIQSANIKGVQVKSDKNWENIYSLKS